MTICPPAAKVCRVAIYRYCLLDGTVGYFVDMLLDVEEQQLGYEGAAGGWGTIDWG